MFCDYLMNIVIVVPDMFCPQRGMVTKNRMILREKAMNWLMLEDYEIYEAVKLDKNILLNDKQNWRANALLDTILQLENKTNTCIVSRWSSKHIICSSKSKRIIISPVTMPFWEWNKSETTIRMSKYNSARHLTSTITNIYETRQTLMKGVGNFYIVYGNVRDFLYLYVTGPRSRETIFYVW